MGVFRHATPSRLVWNWAGSKQLRSPIVSLDIALITSARNESTGYKVAFGLLEALPLQLTYLDDELALSIAGRFKVFGRIYSKEVDANNGAPDHASSCTSLRCEACRAETVLSEAVRLGSIVAHCVRWTVDRSGRLC